MGTCPLGRVSSRMALFKCQEELRGIFAFTPINDGKVFGEEPNDIAIPATLKKAAREAQGT